MLDAASTCSRTSTSSSSARAAGRSSASPTSRAAKSHRIAFPEPVYTAGPSNNREFDTSTLRFAYQSPITAAVRLRLRPGHPRAQAAEAGGRCSAATTRRATASRRTNAKAPDGDEVPVSLVYRKDLQARRHAAPRCSTPTAPTGHRCRAGFSSNIFSLLDRGVVYAIAHIRGGGDLGKKWHDARADADEEEHLHRLHRRRRAPRRRRSTRARDRLVITGGSAGGLLMGAVVNMRPDLFKAVVAHVPFVDVINTMLDESLPLTVGEFEEWGNPKERGGVPLHVSYSPYDNLAARAYPAMLVKTSYND